MRRRVLSLSVALAAAVLASACAGARPPLQTQTLGPNPDLQPRLRGIPHRGALVLRLAQPTYVGVFEIIPTGANVLHPAPSQYGTLLPRGQHELAAPGLWNPAAFTAGGHYGRSSRYCPNPGELTWYGRPDSPRFPRPATVVRVVQRRGGGEVTCYRLPAYSPATGDEVRHFLVVASRTPLTGDHVASAIQQFHRQVFTTPLEERASELARLLVSEAGLREWSASYRQLPLSR